MVRINLVGVGIWVIKDMRKFYLCIFRFIFMWNCFLYFLYSFKCDIICKICDNRVGNILGNNGFCLYKDRGSDGKSGCVVCGV